MLSCLKKWKQKALRQTNHGYESPKQALETNSAAELRGTDSAWGGRAQRS